MSLHPDIPRMKAESSTKFGGHLGELLLEKVFECAPRVLGAYGPRSRIALHRHAERKEDALVASALVRDTL